MSLRSRVWTRICKEEMADQAGRMWEALSAGMGGGQQRHPGEQEEVKSVRLGKMSKGAQRGEGGETVTEAEKEAGRGEQRALWPENEMVPEGAFWPQNTQSAVVQRVWMEAPG